VEELCLSVPSITLFLVEASLVGWCAILLVEFVLVVGVEFVLVVRFVVVVGFILLVGFVLVVGFEVGFVSVVGVEFVCLGGSFVLESPFALPWFSAGGLSEYSLSGELDNLSGELGEPDKEKKAGRTLENDEKNPEPDLFINDRGLLVFSGDSFAWWYVMPTCAISRTTYPSL
jgi:hypothetical protein